MTELFNSFLDLFRRKSDPPEGVFVMHNALKELEESTEDLRGTLNEHPQYFQDQKHDPIRDRMVPNNYTPNRG